MCRFIFINMFLTVLLFIHFFFLSKSGRVVFKCSAIKSSSGAISLTRYFQPRSQNGLNIFWFRFSAKPSLYYYSGSGF